MEFSLEELINLLVKKIIFITVFTFAGLLTCYGISNYVIEPSYTASIQMYVKTNDSISSADLNELYYAQKVVNTYIGFLRTKVFYNQVITESKLNYTPGELKDMTAIQTVNNTEIFQISVTSHSPEDSYQLVKVMQTVVPALIKGIKNNTEISIVDPVVFPTAPSGPNVLLNTLFGGIAGFFLSIIIAILWEILNIRVKNQEDLAKKYQIPILGAIPDFKEGRRQWNLLKFIPIPILKKHKVEEKSIYDNTKFIVKEAYKALRTNLQFTLRDSGCKKIIVNSAIPEDGKSTTCTNLAITVAQTGAKVLLMDCDLRKGRLHNYLKLRNTFGVSNVLSGMCSDKDAIQDTSYQNLHVLTRGSIPPNPIELLASAQMKELILKLEKVYDYIIIDTPPVNIVSDVLSITKIVSGAVIIAREGKTTYPNIASALSKYKFAEMNILGFVINGVTFSRSNKLKSKYYRKYNSDSND